MPHPGGVGRGGGGRAVVVRVCVSGFGPADCPRTG